MKIASITVVGGLASLILSAAQATPLQEQTRAEARGELYGMGSGAALMLAASQKAQSVTAIPPASSQAAPRHEQRHYTFGDIQASVLAQTGDGVLQPLSLSAGTPAAVRVLSPKLAGLSRADAISAFGKPEAETATTLTFKTPAVPCAESVELTFRGEQLSAAAWRFCPD